MTEEEKKAIEYLKQNSIPILRYDNFGNILSPLYYGTFEKEIILNLIQKQEKELKEEKEKNKKLEKDNKQLDILVKEKSKDIGYMVLNYISKDKIIEIIEKCDAEYTDISQIVEDLQDLVGRFYDE